MANLVENDVKITLFRMAFPMLAGTIAFNTYNLVDTWYVSRLGTLPLSAMGFTFPVVTFFIFITSGIGNGITTLISYSLGRRDKKNATLIVTHGIMLTILISLTIAILGLTTINEIFQKLGANNEVMPLIKSYMKIWYFGVFTMSFPMMGNGILIALGESRIASLFMSSGAILNCLLDPIMIFGFLGFPKMGICGAALATVISQAISAFLLIYLLVKKHKLIDISKVKSKYIFNNWIKILRFAIPASISMILMPLSNGIITTILSKYGNKVIAGVSAASRVEMFAFVVPMSLGMSMVPFVSQNFGAGKFNRIREARNYSNKFAFTYGILIGTIFFIGAHIIASMFTKDQKVLELFQLYLRTTCFGYGMVEIHRYGGFFLTGIHKPILSTILNAIRLPFLLVSFSLIGSYYSGVKGIFWGRLIADITAGIIAIVFVDIILRKIEEKNTGDKEFHRN